MRGILVLLKLFLKTLIDLLVAVTIMTTLGLIFGILAFAKTPGGGVSQIMKALCWAIGIFGLLAVVAQIHRTIKRKALQQRIAYFYTIGHNMMAKCFEPQTYGFDRLSQEYNAWRTDFQSFCAKSSMSHM